MSVAEQEIRHDCVHDGTTPPPPPPPPPSESCAQQRTPLRRGLAMHFDPASFRLLDVIPSPAPEVSPARQPAPSSRHIEGDRDEREGGRRALEGGAVAQLSPGELRRSAPLEDDDNDNAGLSSTPGTAHKNDGRVPRTPPSQAAEESRRRADPRPGNCTYGFGGPRDENDECSPTGRPPLDLDDAGYGEDCEWEDEEEEGEEGGDGLFDQQLCRRPSQHGVAADWGGRDCANDDDDEQQGQQQRRERYPTPPPPPPPPRQDFVLVMHSFHNTYERVVAHHRLRQRVTTPMRLQAATRRRQELQQQRRREVSESTLRRRECAAMRRAARCQNQCDELQRRLDRAAALREEQFAKRRQCAAAAEERRLSRVAAARARRVAPLIAHSSTIIPLVDALAAAGLPVQHAPEEGGGPVVHPPPPSSPLNVPALPPRFISAVAAAATASSKESTTAAGVGVGANRDVKNGENGGDADSCKDHTVTNPGRAALPPPNNAAPNSTPDAAAGAAKAAALLRLPRVTSLYSLQYLTPEDVEAILVNDPVGACEGCGAAQPAVVGACPVDPRKFHQRALVGVAERLLLAHKAAMRELQPGGAAPMQQQQRGSGSALMSPSGSQCRLDGAAAAAAVAGAPPPLPHCCRVGGRTTTTTRVMRHSTSGGNCSNSSSSFGGGDNNVKVTPHAARLLLSAFQLYAEHDVRCRHTAVERSEHPHQQRVLLTRRAIKRFQLRALSALAPARPAGVGSRSNGISSGGGPAPRPAGSGDNSTTLLSPRGDPEDLRDDALRALAFQTVHALAGLDAASRRLAQSAAEMEQEEGEGQGKGQGGALLGDIADAVRLATLRFQNAWTSFLAVATGRVEIPTAQQQQQQQPGAGSGTCENDATVRRMIDTYLRLYRAQQHRLDAAANSTATCTEDTHDNKDDEGGSGGSADATAEAAEEGSPGSGYERDRGGCGSDRRYRPHSGGSSTCEEVEEMSAGARKMEEKLRAAAFRRNAAREAAKAARFNQLTAAIERQMRQLKRCLLLLGGPSAMAELAQRTEACL